MGKFFAQDPQQGFSDLLSGTDVLPTPYMSLEDQLNSVTRLVLILFLLLVLFNFENSFYFLVFSVVIIILVYYIKRGMPGSSSGKEKYTTPLLRKQVVEGYSTPSSRASAGASRASEGASGPGVSLQNMKARGSPVVTYDMKSLAERSRVVRDGKTYDRVLIQTPQNIPFCNDAVSIDPPDPFAVQLNQNLTGNVPNPKTLISPVVAPPITDLGYWRENNLIVHSHINSAGQQEDMYLSGYAESTCCDYLPHGTELVPDVEQELGTRPVGGSVLENYETGYKNFCDMPKGNNPGGIVAPIPAQQIQRVPAVYSSPDVTSKRFMGVTVPQRGSADGPPVGWYTPLQRTADTPPSREASRFQERYVAPREGGYNTNGKPCSRTGPGIRAPIPVQQVQKVPVLSRLAWEGGNASSTQERSASVLGEYTPILSSSPARGGRENFGYGNLTTSSPGEEFPVYVQENQPGWVNAECGYHPEQVFTSNLPSNLTVGKCQADPRMSKYNDNIFTQIVTPGVYTKSQVNEPINANIGISFQQQFEPVTCSRNERGLHYLQHDPRIIEQGIEANPDNQEDYDNGAPKAENVYDPRFTGYGTSYRSYLDPLTGQTRFFYSDVDAIRMPNLITRSKIDHLPYADTYGPIQDGNEAGNIHTPHMRALVQDSWLRDSLAFRNDITERAMRKVNAEAWQKKASPLGPRQYASRGGGRIR